MGREIELKLELERAGADALEASGLLGTRQGTAALRAVYFDTPERCLRKNDLSLRIREEDGRQVQTIKSAHTPGAALFSREEWEQPVEGPEPELADTPLPVLLGESLDQLEPVFEIVVERCSWEIVQGDAEISVALDCGEARAGERIEPICELEFELVRGKRRALFALARRIDAIAPVRIGVLSKAERGYRLFDPLETAHKAERVRLDPATEPANALAAIAASCMRQYRLNEEILLVRPNPEAIHQARVALRRLRTALAVFKPLLVNDPQLPLRDGLKALVGTLGTARDLDLFAARPMPPSLEERVAVAREKAHAALEKRLAAASTRRLLLDSARWLTTGAWRSDPGPADIRQTALTGLAENTLDRLRRKLRKHGRHFATLDDTGRHRVRKDAKRLRYSAEFFAPLFGAKRRRKKFLAALEDLQNALGILNDQATAERQLGEFGLCGDAAAEPVLADHDEHATLDDAAEAYHALIKVKPFWR